jgi:hypothetical protein
MSRSIFGAEKEKLQRNAPTYTLAGYVYVVERTEGSTQSD